MIRMRMVNGDDEDVRKWVNFFTPILSTCYGYGQFILDKNRSKFTAIQFHNSRFNRCLESGLRPELVKSGQSERMALASQLHLGNQPMEAKKESAKPKELDMWESVMACHRLVLSQTAGISLMVVPSR